VTYNSLPLTLIRKDEKFDGESRSTALYYLTDPPTGSAYTIQVNYSGAVYRSVGGAVSLTGVEQSNPVDAQNGVAGAAADTNPRVTVTTNTDGAWVVDALCIRNATGTSSVVGTQTERWNYRTTNNNIDGAGSTMGPKSPAGDVTMSWTTGTNSGYSISAVALKPAGAGNICWSSELLTNPGFETGDATGWTNGGGGFVDIGNMCISCDDSPHSGSYMAYWNADSESTYYLYQTVDLSSYASDIDAGNAVITATGWLISNEYPAQDLFDMEVRFYDGTLTEIVGDRYDTGTQDVDTWGQYGIQSYTIPTGARSVEVRFNTWENCCQAGSADDFSVKVGTRCPVTTFEKRVTASSDDAEEPAAGGTPSLTSSDLELVDDGGLQQVGMRFTGVTVPSGATISDAYIQFTNDSETGYTEQTDLILYGEKQPDPLTFTTGANNITGRNANKTSAEVQWDNLPQWTPADQTWNSPNIATVIQEIVDQPGWNSGQAMVIMVVGNPSGHRNAHSYDQANPNFAPLLHIEYTTDNTPDAFDFTDQTDVAVSTLVESDIELVTGMDNGTAISIDGVGSSEYRICTNSDCSTVAHTWASTAGTIDAGEYVQLRLTSSASNSTATVATLTVGTLDVDWSVTTAADPEVPTDQFSGNPVLSVGKTATELDNEGTITVASNIATFSIAFPTFVGVGDVVQYDVDNDTVIEEDEYGIIRGINSSRTKAYLLKIGGGNVTDTTATTAVYDIFRAYTSLANWQSGTENTNIDRFN
jgi:hypothetical protein